MRKDGQDIKPSCYGLLLEKKVLTMRIGYSPLLREYVHYLRAKLAFHQQHPEFNGKLEASCHVQMTYKSL